MKNTNQSPRGRFFDRVSNMKRRIAIFGPPGVGKSTLIKKALEKRIKAYDFENFSSETRKERAMKIFEQDFSDIMLFNAADMQPNEFPSDVELLLLLPPKGVYLKRMKKRDKTLPSKAEQAGLDVYDGFSEHKEIFHRVIEDVATPNKVLDKIINPKKF